MKLLTKAIEKTLPALYSQEREDPIVHVKFFMPSGRYTLYVTEGEKQANGDWRFFGWCVSALGEDCDEFGYTMLSDLQSVKGQFGLGIERDLWFVPKPLSQVVGK